MSNQLIRFHTRAMARLANDRGNEVVSWIMMALVAATIATALGVALNTWMDGKIADFLGL